MATVHLCPAKRLQLEVGPQALGAGRSQTEPLECVDAQVCKCEHFEAGSLEAMSPPWKEAGLRPTCEWCHMVDYYDMFNLHFS